MFAFMLSTGQGGLAVNQAKATEFYGRSALQRHEDSMFQYGMRLFEGIGVDADQAAGRKWIRRAAACKHEQALKNLGCIEVFGMSAKYALSMAEI